MTDKIINFMDLETAARQFQDAIIYAYNENCPLTMRRNNRNIYWWNRELAEKRRKVGRLFNTAKKSGNWTDYKRSLTDYNKALRQNHGEDTVRRLRRPQNVPDSIGSSQRVGRVQLAPSSLEMENIPRQRRPWKNYYGSLPWLRNNLGTFWRLGQC
jgi:DNA helicase IV